MLVPIVLKCYFLGYSGVLFPKIIYLAKQWFLHVCQITLLIGKMTMNNSTFLNDKVGMLDFLDNYFNEHTMLKV